MRASRVGSGRPLRSGAGLLAVGLVVTVLGGCHAGGGRAAPSAAQVRDLLARHGRAVHDRSSAAFLADVDRSSAAAAFRSRQAAQFAALAAVPLRSWSYTLDSIVSEPPATAAASARLGTPSVIARVSVTYALAGVDPTPVSHALWWTVADRGGRAVLAGDDDLASEAGVSWRGPWDFGPLVAVRGAACLILAHPGGDPTLLSALAADLDAAVAAVTTVWGPGWAGAVVALVPGSAAEAAQLGGPNAAFSDVSAVTAFEDPATPSTPAAGARVILNPGVLSTLTPVGRSIVMRHEVTHVASAAATGAGSPRWLVEGLAEYVAHRDTGQPVSSAARELAAEVAERKVPAALPGDGEFDPSGGRAAQAYEEAWLACRLVAARAGPAGLVALYREVGVSPAGSDEALRAAMEDVLHESPTAFTAQWRAYLIQQLRPA